jgi:hypothetical protein
MAQRVITGGVALVLLVGLALGCATAPPLPSGATPQQQRIDRLLGDIRLPQFAEKLEAVSLRVGGHPHDGRFPEEQRLRPRIETQLAPDAVVADVMRHVAESFDEIHVAELERFNASPLGRKVDAAAEAPYSWFSRVGYRMFGSVSDITPERVALVEKLDALTSSTRTSTELYMAVYEAIVRWYDQHGFIDPKESEAVGGIDGLVAREREKVQMNTTQHSVPFGLYALSDLSTPELAEYVGEVESPAGQWYSKAVRDALIETIGTRSAAISQ